MVLPACALQASAQSFYVRGLVQLNRPSGPPAVMATVLIPGTLFGGITNEEGGFELGPVPGGEYSLRVLVAGYKDVVVTVNVTNADVYLELVSRRADVDLDKQNEETADPNVRFGTQTFVEPGSLVDLLRIDPTFEVGRVGWAGGRLQKGVPLGPFSSQILTVDGQTIPSQPFFPITSRISGSSRIPRSFSTLDDAVVELAGLGHTTIRSTAVSRMQQDQSFPTIVIDGGAHSNGRLVQGALAIDGQQGRVRYAGSVSATRAGAYESGSGASIESSLRRVAADGSLSLRLTPFSDLLAHYSGSIDGGTPLPGTPYLQDRADDRDGGITFRLSRPESRVNQLSAGVTIGHALEGTSMIGTDGIILPFATIGSDYFDVSVGAGHRLGYGSSGILSASYRGTTQKPSIDGDVASMMLNDWKARDLRIAYSAHGVFSWSTVDAQIDYQGHQVDHVQDRLEFGLVSGQVEVTHKLNSTVRATLHVSTEGFVPGATQLFGRQFPMHIGQRLALIDGSSSLSAERFNTVAIRVSSTKATTAASVSGSIVDLHRYTSVLTSGPQFGLSQSSGTAVALDGRVSLTRPPFASTSLIGAWAYGVDRRTDRRIVGTRSPRFQWNARMQTPGGSVFVQTVVNAVIGLASADLEWERDSEFAVWIDLTAGMKRGRADWIVGITNLNDASWRYHSSLGSFPSLVPSYERGRSFFLRYRRRL